MQKKLEELAPEKADLIKSLRELGIEDDEISKSLNITEEVTEELIEKTVEDQIAEKQAEIDMLKKSENGNDLSGDFDEKFDDISKSFTSQLEKSSEKVEGLVDLVKSLTDKVVTLSENNEQLIKDNDELKKSFSGSEKVLKKLADFTPGLRSISNANHIERFEKSTTADDDSKETLSISKQKSVISSKLSAKMEDPEFAKSLGSDIANFECSGKISPKLEKAFQSEFEFNVVA